MNLECALADLDCALQGDRRFRGVSDVDSHLADTRTDPPLRMDVTRKFIQMGRTRSLRYALRPGGRKYDKTTGKEMKRTGDVADKSKLEGANIFEACLKRIEGDEVYAKAKKSWGKRK